MVLSDVMDALGLALEGVPGLRVFPFYADRVTPPAAVVNWPESYDFDTTMQRGSDTATIPITVVVGRTDARSTRDNLSMYCDGSGATSVKTLIDSYVSPAWSTATVTSVEFGVVSIAGVEYLAATFDVVIFGAG